MPLEMVDLAKRLPTMEFSKIAGVAGLDGEEGLEFIRGLYQATIIAKDNGDWSRGREVHRRVGDEAHQSCPSGRSPV